MSISRHSHPQLEDRLGLLLILLSSILLGVWAVKGTIALRNILLGIETLISVVYLITVFKGRGGHSLKIPAINLLPLILLCLMFFWVIFHYLFLTRFPELQFHELKSTWFRSLVAVIIGVATGLAISKRSSAVIFLWFGLLGSFAYLLYQYISMENEVKGLFKVDYAHYIFYGKIGGVLAGTILIIGLLGSMLDFFRKLLTAQGLIAIVCWIFGTIAVLFSYVFIFDTRNGIGLTVLIYFFGLLFLTVSIVKSIILKDFVRQKLLMCVFSVFIACSVGLVSWFGHKHVEHNSGWSTMIEDVKTSIQIELYPNWKNPHVMGYPKNELGQTVKANTYERLAWAVAGIKIFLPENPWGVGILRGPFTTLLMEKYPDAGAYIPSTHSAWVEIALAYGYLGLALMISSLLAILFLSIKSKESFQGLPFLMSAGLLLLYSVGEISSQHAIEILCFLIALNTAIIFPIKLIDKKSLNIKGNRI